MIEFMQKHERKNQKRKSYPKKISHSVYRMSISRLPSLTLNVVRVVSSPNPKHEAAHCAAR